MAYTFLIELHVLYFIWKKVMQCELLLQVKCLIT